MNAIELIAKAHEAGITLIPEPDGRLTAEGPAPAISELWPEIRQHKADVLALLPANDAPDVVGLVGVGGLLSADSSKPERPSNTSPACSDGDESNSHPSEGSGIPCHRWLVTLPTGERFESSITPAATLEEVLGWYPPKTVVARQHERQE